MPIKVVMPSIGVTMEEGKIVEWFKQEEEKVNKDEPLFAIETDKSSVEVTATADGIIGKILAQVGDVVPVGGEVAVIYTEEEFELQHETGTKILNEPSTSQSEEFNSNLTFEPYVEEQPGVHPPAKNANADEAQPEEGDLLKASPAARRKAKELQVDLHMVSGSGPKGRITEDDVIAYHSRVSETPARAKVEALTRIREITAKRMLTASQTTAMVTLFTTARIDEVVRLRSQLNKTIEKRHGFKITYDAIVAKAAAVALEEHPVLQAQWSDEGLRYPQGIHIGIAIALPKGLVVPVVSHAENQSLISLARQIDHLIKLAREDKLLPDQISGGTFTISNLGMYPIDGFTPIINLPEAAILGIGRIKEQAVVENGQVITGKTTAVSLTFDHRIVDGAPAASFLERVKTLLEEPYQLFLES